ncbi:MAG: hypothetical protein DBX62_02565 [Clostridia bacterium]|nr:MAG: hypothetical protein DBX62_02565 [Clostridia bacterium]
MKKIINALSQKREVFATDVVSVQFALLTLPYICLSASLPDDSRWPRWVRVGALAIMLVLQLIPIVVSLRDAFGKWPDYLTPKETEQCKLRQRAAWKQVAWHMLSSVILIIVIYCQFNVHSPFFGF